MNQELDTTFQRFFLSPQKCQRKEEYVEGTFEILDKKSFPKQLTFEVEESKDESKVIEEAKQEKIPTKDQLIETIQGKMTRKRKGEEDKDISDVLKQMKTDVQSLTSTEKKQLITIQPHRKYPKEMKLKALELSKEIGTLNVSNKTGIPESSSRRWKRTGVDRVESSGRKPLSGS